MSTAGRVLVIDPEPLVRAGLISLLAADSVCGEAGDANQALELVSTLRPDLAILEPTISDHANLQIIGSLLARRSTLSILVVTRLPEQVYRARALRAGAVGFVSKRAPVDQLMTALQQALAGEQASVEEEESAGNLALSDRELQVFELIGRGLGTSRIAESLHLSVKTVETHKQRIKRKLELRTSEELLVQAISWNHSAWQATERSPTGPDPHDRGLDPPDPNRVYCLSSPVLPNPVLLGRETPTVFGRQRGADVRINSSLVSREHALILWEPTRGYVLRDLSSFNGTYLNGYRLRSPCVLQHGDVLNLGDAEYVFQTVKGRNTSAGEKTVSWARSRPSTPPDPD